MKKVNQYLIIGILIACLILLVFIFINQINKQKFEKDNLEREMMFKCEEYGMKKYGEKEKVWENLESTLVRSFYFSPQLNTCVVEHQYLSPGNIDSIYILDMATDEVLFEYVEICEEYNNNRLIYKQKYPEFEIKNEECVSLDNFYIKKEKLLK